VTEWLDMANIPAKAEAFPGPAGAEHPILLTVSK
jgi:hypothetical protein